MLLESEPKVIDPRSTIKPDQLRPGIFELTKGLCKMAQNFTLAAYGIAQVMVDVEYCNLPGYYLRELNDAELSYVSSAMDIMHRNNDIKPRFTTKCPVHKLLSPLNFYVTGNPDPNVTSDQLQVVWTEAKSRAMSKIFEFAKAVPYLDEPILIPGSLNRQIRESDEALKVKRVLAASQLTNILVDSRVRDILSTHFGEINSFIDSQRIRNFSTQYTSKLRYSTNFEQLSQDAEICELMIINHLKGSNRGVAGDNLDWQKYKGQATWM